MEIERFIEGDKQEDDVSLEVSLRPKVFEDFPGQDKVKQKLKVFTEAAKKRGPRGNVAESVLHNFSLTELDLHPGIMNVSGSACND